MSYYYHAAAQQVEQFPADVFAAWVEHSNPKADGWAAIGDPPGQPQDYSYSGSAWVEQPWATVAARKAALLGRIDGDVDAVYDAQIGRRTTEYMRAEVDALAYQEAGFTGPVPEFVENWVGPSGLGTAQAAAQNILATAAAWRGAEASIRSARLTHKSAARAATTQQGLDGVAASWRGTLNAIRAALGLPGV